MPAFQRVAAPARDAIREIEAQLSAKTLHENTKPTALKPQTLALNAIERFWDQLGLQLRPGFWI